MTPPSRILGLLCVTPAVLAAASLLVGAGDGHDDLLVLCAASQRRAIEPAARRFGDERGFEVALSVGGSGLLASQLVAAGRGDVFVSADRTYLDRLAEGGLIHSRRPAGRMRAIWLTRSDGPRSFADALQKGSRLALASPDSAAIGALVKLALQERGQWSDVETLVRQRGVFKSTVVSVLNDVQLGAVEAGVVWDAVWQSSRGQLSELEALDTAELGGVVGRVEVAVLTTSTNRAASDALAEQLASELAGPATGEEP